MIKFLVLLIFCMSINTNAQKIHLKINDFYYNSDNDLIVDYSISNDSNQNLFLFDDFTLTGEDNKINYLRINFFLGENKVSFYEEYQSTNIVRLAGISKSILFILRGKVINKITNLSKELPSEQLELLDNYLIKNRPNEVELTLTNVGIYAVNPEIAKKLSYHKVKEENFTGFKGTVISNRFPLRKSLSDVGTEPDHKLFPTYK